MEFKGIKISERENEYIAPIDVSENKAGRFLSLSVFLHAALVAVVTMMSIPPLDLNKNEVVEFEVESDVAAVKAIPDGAPVPETQGPPPAPASVQELPQVPVAKAEPKAAEPLPVVAPKVAVVAVPPQAPPIAKSAPVAVVAPAPVRAAPVAMPDTLDDIETPELETSDSGEVAVAQIDEKDLQDDFDKVDQEQSKALAVAKQSLDEDTDNASAEGETALADVENENKAQAIAAAKAVEARRAKDAAAIASAQAAEQAVAERAAAAAAAEKAAAEKAALLAAQKEARRGQGTGGEGEGTGNSGSPEPTKQVAGIPGGVRALDQLRQMPGNKFPQYESSEQLARQEGQTIFYAYVNKDGSLSQFKLGQSTGFRNLDSKTLIALKKWKFYPGQEGWVELPFKWSLVGDPKEAGGQLRSSVK